MSEQPKAVQERPGQDQDKGFTTVKLDPSKTTEIMQTEISIQNWAMQYAELSLKLRSIESTIQSLYQHKASLMSEGLKDAGEDMSQYVRAQMGPDGTVILMKKPQPPQAHPGPAE